jgi:hypothetical protein
MNKILITGFKHSGTTMLLGLLRNHPQVGWIEMEESYIEYDKPKKWVLQMASKRVRNMKKNAWGDKIPWGHKPEDKNAKRAIAFTKKWIKYFGKQSRILHIMRHPIDAASSGRPDGNPGDVALKRILNSVPAYIDFINNSFYCATIVYEDLLINPPEHLRNIFNFCGLMYSEKIVNRVMNGPLKYGKINPDRAYAFKKKGIKDTVDYEGMKERLYIRL